MPPVCMATGAFAGLEAPLVRVGPRDPDIRCQLVVRLHEFVGSVAGRQPKAKTVPQGGWRVVGGSAAKKEKTEHTKAVAASEA